MKEHLFSKKSALAICGASLMLMCMASGCGGNDDTAEIVQYTAETAVSKSADEKGNIIVQSGNQDDNVHIQIQDFNKTFNRHNYYTGEVEYSYQIDEIEASWETDDCGCDIKLLFTGKKTYDAKGSDAARYVKSEVRLIDEDGYVIESFTLYSEETLCEGDTFEKEEFECSTYNMDNIQLEDGNYTLEFISEDANKASLAGSDGDKPNPERHYCPYAIPCINESDAELPFDTNEEWIDLIALKDVYITDEGILKGLFEEDFDLSNADDTEEVATSNDSFFEDVYYGKTIYYDIDNPEEYLTGVPDEAMPDSVRISFNPEGSSICGERRNVTVSLGYKHDKDDKYTYAALAFQYFPGNALTEDEWNAVIEMAESIGVEVPQ